MAGIHLTNAKSVINMINNGLYPQTYFNFVTGDFNIPLYAPIQGMGVNNKDLRCAVVYYQHKFDGHKMHIPMGYLEDTRNQDGSTTYDFIETDHVDMAGEFILLEHANILPDFVIVSDLKSSIFGDLISLLESKKIPYLVIRDILTVLDCIVHVASTIISPEVFEDEYPPEIYEDNTTERLYDRYYNRFLPDILENHHKFNDCFGSAFDQFQYTLIFTFLHLWLNNQPSMGYDNIES